MTHQTPYRDVTSLRGSSRSSKVRLPSKEIVKSMCLCYGDQDGGNRNPFLLPILNGLRSQYLKAHFASDHLVSKCCLRRFRVILNTDFTSHEGKSDSFGHRSLLLKQCQQTVGISVRGCRE